MADRQRPEGAESGRALVVHLLGDFAARRGGEVVKELASPRLQSLLAYLIVHRDRAISRQRLAFLFWPDSNEKQARTNLRQSLHNLRLAIDEPNRYLAMDNRTVRWIENSGADIDVVRFERSAHAGLESGDERALAAAANEYRGDLLAGCYDDWAAAPRAQLRAVVNAVLDALLTAAHRRGDTGAAITVAERMLLLDPLDESTYRRLIALHAGGHDRVRALRTYHQCVAVLDRELGVAPDRATVELYESVVTARSEPVDERRPPPPAGMLERLPVIGRDDELDRLVALWHATAPGRPHFVLVTGEPGIGKSRLVEEVRAWCTSAGVANVGARAYEAAGALPYGPVIELLRADAMRARRARLDPASMQVLARVLPEVADPTPLTGVEAPARDRLFAAIAAVIAAAGHPLVVALDDIHWCDADTLALVEFTMRAAASSAAPLLVVATARDEELAYRPELRAFVARLHGLGVAVELPLERLDADASADLARLALGGVADDPIIEELVGAAAGNPLFLVEMARSARTGRSAGGGDGGVPPRVQAVIESRLDQLSPAARELATVAAVVGRAFTIDTVAHLIPDEGDAVAAIDELWRRRIVRECGVDSYDFTHDKIREVTYRGLGPGRRRRLHAAVAAALSTGVTAVEAAHVAHHFEQAGQVAAALDAYRRAVAGSAHAFAHQDVIASCRRALQLVAACQPGPERDDAELDFLVPLGVALMAGPGIAQTETAVYERARVLRGQRGLPPEPSTLRISANAAIGRREYREARRYGEILLQRGLDEHDGILVTEGHYLKGVTSFWLGEIDASRHHLEAALASHRIANTAVHLEQFGQDPRAVCFCRLAFTRYQQAADAVADELLDEAFTVAAATGHGYTDIYVRMFAAWLLADSGRVPAANRVIAGIASGDVTNTMDPIARTLFGGWALLADGDPHAALPLLHEAQRLAHHIGPQMHEPLTLLVLADALAAAGAPADALHAAVTAGRIADAEMPFHLPEALRRQGELVLADDAARGLAVLERASRVAQEHGNVVHELRARTALLRAVRHLDADAAAGCADAVRALCDRLPSDCRLGDVVAARGELVT